MHPKFQNNWIHQADVVVERFEENVYNFFQSMRMKHPAEAKRTTGHSIILRTLTDDMKGALGELSDRSNEQQLTELERVVSLAFRETVHLASVLEITCRSIRWHRNCAEQTKRREDV